MVGFLTAGASVAGVAFAVLAGAATFLGLATVLLAAIFLVVVFLVVAFLATGFLAPVVPLPAGLPAPSRLDLSFSATSGSTPLRLDLTSIPILRAAARMSSAGTPVSLASW